MRSRKTIISLNIFLVAFTSYAQVEEKDWYNEDFDIHQGRGLSINSFYENFDDSELKEVVVAVIDNGVDIQHEDLKDQIWINKDEIPSNGIDDDKNGYVDDIHGWNYLGNPDGQNINFENLELTRIYREYLDVFEDVKVDTLSGTQIDDFAYFKSIEKQYQEELKKIEKKFEEYAQLTALYSGAISYFQSRIGSDELTINDILNYEPLDEDEMEVKGFLLMADSEGLREYIEEAGEYFDAALNYHYNLEFQPRSLVNEKLLRRDSLMYGNNMVWAHQPDHGTHVAGIIGANRNNDIGVRGMATNAKIMVLRAVPNGDERDEDIAHAILYATDNGASIINMSFGKTYSTNAQIVNDAVDYALSKDVLIIHSAGNDSENIDQTVYYPDLTYKRKKSKRGVLVVGAYTHSDSSEVVASYSNTGKRTVDLMAPGSNIYSTISDSKYKWESGTSMSAPVVSGLAAIYRGLRPELSAEEIKKMILESVVEKKNLETTYKGQRVKLKELIRTPGFLTISGKISSFSK